MNGHNRILAGLSPKERTRLIKKMREAHLETKALLYELDAPITQVYFPMTGVTSLVTASDGKILEVATVGNEGMVGLPLFFRSDRIHMRAFEQIAGDALVMSAKHFQQEVRDPNSELSDALYKYTQAFFMQVTQNAACNALHDVDTRCARWMLLTHDRVGVDTFPLTHEFLAQMLGVRRASVSMTAGKLQEAGLIRYKRGVVTVLKRRGLERAACEHYQLVRAEYNRLLPIVNKGTQARAAERRRNGA